VKFRAALVVPIATFPNAWEAGVKVRGAMPVPVTLTERGLPNPL
jgi:hypothetical protein